MTKKPIKHKVHKEVREVIVYAEQFGYTVDKFLKNGHLRIKIDEEGGPMVTLPSSPGSRSWEGNARAEIRRRSRQFEDAKRRATLTNRKQGSVDDDRR